MTKINDYMWQLPHDPLPDDPVEITALKQLFNAPLTAAVSGLLDELGYELSASDIIVPPDTQVDMYEKENFFRANIRFIQYLTPEIMVRVHFEHHDWSSRLINADEHTFFVNLDRFKLVDTVTKMPEPNWPGRLHTRMSSMRQQILHHSGEDQLWTFSTAGEFDELIRLFLEKFERLGHLWLIDTATLNG